MDNQAFARSMERIRQGDKEALKEIYDAYAGYLFYLVLAILGSREDSEDVTSDVFLKIWKAAEHYSEREGHRAWLAMIARNTALDFLRKRQRELPGGLEEVERMADESLPGQERKDAYEDVLSEMSVSQMLEVLKPAEREVVHLKTIGGLTFAEISQVVHSPMGTVTGRYRSAMQKLRRCLGE